MWRCACTCMMSAVRHLVIRSEDVEGQGFLSLIDKPDCFVQAADRHDGKQRSKYLLLHHLRLGLHITQNHGGLTKHRSTMRHMHVLTVCPSLLNIGKYE